MTALLAVCAAVCAAGWLGHSGLLEGVDAIVWDAGQRLRPTPPDAGNVALVLIDAEDVRRYGPWPFDRTLYARMLDRLVAGGARGVAFDVLFVAPSADRPEGDRALVDAVARHAARVVLPFRFVESNVADGTLTLVAEVRAEPLFPDLARALRHTGFAAVPLLEGNPDGILRRALLRKTLDGRVLPSFALALGVLGGGASEDSWPSDVPVELRFRAASSFTSWHVRDVLEPAVGPDVSGRVVLVGASAPQLMDVKATPVGLMPGVELNANMLACILEDEWLRKLSPAKSGAACALLGLFGAGVALVLPAPLAVAALVALALAWAGAALGATALAGRLLPVVAPALAMAGGLAAALAIRSSRREGAADAAGAAAAASPGIEAARTLDAALALAAAGRFAEALGAVQQLGADQEGALAPVSLERSRALRLELLARLGESRLLELSLPTNLGADPEILYGLARALEEEGYLTHARTVLERIFRRDLGFRDVEGRLADLRERGRRGELTVNVKGVRELLGARFSKVRLLAEGGMGVLFTAEDGRTGRTVVVKVLHPYLQKEERALKRFLSEVKAMTTLKHPNIVRVYEVELGKAPYFTMEFCPGVTLEALLRQPGPLDPSVALRVVRGMAAGLAHAHERRIVHRDLKPANVLVADDGGVKLIDFGVAKSEFSRGLTVAGEVVGTRGYMAPEQEAGGEAGPAADLYSLGVVLKEVAAAVRAGPATSATPAPGSAPAAPSGPSGPSGGDAASEVASALERAADALVLPDPARRPADATARLVALADEFGSGCKPTN